MNTTENAQVEVHVPNPPHPSYPDDESAYCGLQPPYAVSTGAPNEIVCADCSSEMVDDAWRAKTDDALRAAGLFPPKATA